MAYFSDGNGNAGNGLIDVKIDAFGLLYLKIPNSDDVYILSDREAISLAGRIRVLVKGMANAE